MIYTVVVFSFVFCVKGDDGYKFVKPTPVVRNPSGIQSTDQLNPLKLNVQSEPKAFTTGQSVLLNPTPIFNPLQTTGIAVPGVNFDPVRIRLTTTFIDAPSDNPLVDPTPVLNGLTRLETAAGNPLMTNLPLIPPLTTAIAGNGVIEPTPVVLTLGTKPAAMANDDEQILLVRPATGNTGSIFIEPSQVYLHNGGSMTGAHTSQPEQGPDQVSSTISINGPLTKTVESCKCKYFEETPTPAFGSYDTENALTSQSLTPEGSKPNVWELARPPNDIRQLIVSLHLNLYINNIPILAANAVPLYF